MRSVLSPAAAKGDRRASVRVGATSRTRTAVTAEVGVLFRDLRRLLGMTAPDIARRAGTSVDVILALEAGDVSKLPPWAETARVVSSLTGLAHIDPAPALAILRIELQRRGPHRGGRKSAAERGAGARRALGAKVASLKGIASSVARAAIVRAGGVSRMALAESYLPRPRTRGVMAAGILALVAGVCIAGSAMFPSAGVLQGPIARFMRSSQDFMLVRMAPMREGLRWIDVDDPRSRRADKLEPGRH